jgi:hypothetical protein
MDSQVAAGHAQLVEKLKNKEESTRLLGGVSHVK